MNFGEQIAEHVEKRSRLQEAISWCNTKNDAALIEVAKRNLKLAVLHQLKEANDRMLSDYMVLSQGPNEERSGSLKFGTAKIAELEATLAQVSQ